MIASEKHNTMPVTSLEHLFLAADRPQHNMSFFLVLRTQGAPDSSRIQEAFKKAQARHPLLRAVMKGDPLGVTSQLEWDVLSEESHGGVIWNPKQLETIDITKEPGIRLYVRTHADDDDELIFQFHHSATDARGGMQFIEDFLGHYAGNSARMIELDPALLSFRGDTRHEGVNHKLNALRYVDQYASLYLQKCAPLASATHATGEFNAALWPCRQSKTFDPGDYRRLKSRTIQKSCTINDLLMRDIMLALAEWNQSHGLRQDIRLQMAVNMRTVSDARMPAANHGSFCNVDCSLNHTRDPRLLLTQIRRETTHVKDNRLGYAMMLMASAMGKIKGGMQSLLRMKRSQSVPATAVVSNLGEVFRYALFGKPRDGFHQAGDLRIVDVSYLPALKPGVKVSFGIATTMRRLNVSMHYDQTALSHDDAKLVFEMVTERIGETIGKGAVSGEDLKALIERHKQVSSEKADFRSLPLGKHVATSVRLEMQEGRPGHGTVEQLH